MRSLVAVLLLAVVGAGLGFAAAAAPVGDTSTDAETFAGEEVVFDDEVDRSVDPGYETAGETDEREIQATSETSAVDSSLQDATGETVVILDVERDIDVDATAAGDATSVLKADSAATLEPVAAAVDGFEAATVRNEVWVGNLLSVEIDLDTHDAAELADIDGVQRVVPNIEFEHPSAGDVSTEESVERAQTDDLTYGLEQIDIPGFEEEFDGERGGNATVAIVDDGLSDPEEGHPDLDIAQKFLVQGGEETEGIVEPGAHGEHVAGTATGAADPVGDVPRFGVAPEAELIKIDVFGDDPGASFEDIAIGLELSADEGADVAGFSLGAANPEFEESTFEPTFTETVEEANAAGTVVTVSSGNEGSGSDGGQVTSPGTQFDSFTVGASNPEGEIAGFSSGAVINDDSVLTVLGEPVDLPETFPTEYVKPDVSAAGASVLSSGPLGIAEPDPNAEYSFADGTSMAQPHVAGAVALLQSLTDEQVPVKQIESALAETAERPADAPGATIHDRNIRYGTGIINVTAAGLALEETQTITGTVTDSETGESLVGATVETDDGALTTVREDGEFTLHTTSDPAEVTADEFGFAPATQTVSGGETVDFELGTSVEVTLIQGQPFAVPPGESFDIIVDVQDLEVLTVELTEESDVGPEQLTLSIGEDEIPLGETVEFDEAITGEVALTVETDAGIEQGSAFGLVHTFAGLGEEITVETGPTTVEDLQGPDIELSDLEQPDQLELDELIESTVTATNVGDEPYDGGIIQILRGDFDGDGDETIISIGPQDLQLDPGESAEITDDLLTFEDIDAALPDVDFEVGDDVPTGFQVATEEALEDDELPFFDDADLEDELLEDITIVDEATDQPFFQVSDLSAPAEADPGATIDVSATITNIGDEPGTQDVDFVFDGDVVETEPGVELDPEDDELVEFTDIPLPEEDGVFEHGVFTDDDDETAEIVVGDVEEPVIELVELNQPDELALDEDIVSEVTIENTGGAPYEGELLQATNLNDVEPVGAIAIVDDVVEVSLDPGEEFTTEQNLGSFADINGGLGTDFGPGDEVETGYQLGQNLDFTEDPEPVVEDIFSETIEITGEAPELVIDSADAPEEIAPDEDLEVDFVVENIGEATGDTFVDLFVDAVDGFVDFDDVVVDPGETGEGTLVFDEVDESYDAGDTIQWAVELFDFDDIATGETNVAEAEPPEVALSNLSIAGQGESATVLEGDHDVSANMTHVGGGVGEVEMSLTIGDAVEETATVDIGEGETATVTFADVTTDLGPGVYDVEMSAQNETLTGELTVSVDVGGDEGTPATDTTGDGLLDDLTGDGEFTIMDVQALFESFNDDAIQDNIELFDFAENDRVSIFDVQALFTDLE